MEEQANYEKKYRALKKKHKTLVTDKEGVDQQLMLTKKRVARLQKERSFLLDRLLQYEQVSSDSESERSSPESNDEKERDDMRPAKKIKREEPPVKVNIVNGREGREGGGGRRGARQRTKGDSEEQVCIARGKDKPCKSKALQGFKYCWHHAPLDPATGFIFCQYRDANKRNAKKCNIPVHKDKPEPFCNYHVKRLQKQSHQPGLKGSDNNGLVDPNANNLIPGEGEVEVFGDDVFSDQDDGLDVSGSGDEATSPPENGVMV
eukprot:Phypoly_transcript_13523.p1 GENE.Phypoly_transcript_13523~~Phypoly_transcript_13523.p1  ORF type:complete len:262 (-),score=47.27 Phypoly_transcript_13523:25-810(-)